MSKDTQEIIAISLSEAKLYGCPHCGAKGGRITAHGNSTHVFKCEKGCRIFCIVNDGLERSGIGLDGKFPSVITHPMKQKK